MGLMTAFKANKAYRLQQKGDREGALKLYEEAYAEGLNDARYNLAYALLLIRRGEYQKAKDFLVKHQKVLGMTTEQRVNLLVDYAVCCLRLGDVDKGISVLEQQFRKTETGSIYQTLGYLYVEKYDAANRPDFEALKEAAPEAEAAAEAAPEAEAAGETAPEAAPETEAAPEAEAAVETAPAAEPAGETAPEAPAEKALSPEEAWQAGQDKAEEFIRQGVDYDNQDAICLDNLGQFCYRVKGDKDEAKKWFKKALAIREGQIDTLYFLSRYDEEAGDKDAALDKLEKALGGRFSPLNYCTREMVEKEIARLKGER